MQTTALIRLRSGFDETGTKLVERLCEGVADGKTVWSWHPLLVSSRRRFGGLDRASQDRQFADDGDKKELVAGESAA
jgi:hypothetical protein